MIGIANVDIWDLTAPTKALRHLFLGRVLLKSDLSSGVTIPVGTTTIPGTMLFKNKSTACKLVEPETTVGAADGHEEDITIVNPTSGEPLNITASAAPSLDYTTANGAYLAIKTMPTAISSLKLVTQDIQVADLATRHELPALFVRLVDTQKVHQGSTQWRFTFLWQCKYYRARTEGEDVSDAFYDDLAVILNQVEEDPRLGATAHEAEVRQVQRIITPDLLGEGSPFDIAQFTVWAQVDRTHNKALG